MTLTDLQRQAWERFRTERDDYAAAAESIQTALSSAARAAGVRAAVSVRAKDVASFAKKIIVKGYTDPWNQVTDKVGARIVVDEPGDCPRIFDALPQETIQIIGPIVNKADTWKVNQLGYLGRHCQIQLPHVRDCHGSVIECELQVRTRAEDAWAVVEHRLKYKGAVTLDRNADRRILRLIALVELFDSEVEAAVRDIKETADYALLSALRTAESSFLEFGPAAGNDDLSLAVLDEVLTAAPPGELYDVKIRDFTAANHAALAFIYHQYGDPSDEDVDGRYLLLSQPESIVIFERIATRGLMLASQMGGSQYEMLIRPLYALWGSDWPTS